MIQTKCTERNRAGGMAAQEQSGGHGTSRDCSSGGMQAEDQSGGETLLRLGRDSPVPPHPALTTLELATRSRPCHQAICHLLTRKGLTDALSGDIKEMSCSRSYKT